MSMRRFRLGGTWNSRDRSLSPPPPPAPIGRRVPIQLVVITPPNIEASSEVEGTTSATAAATGTVYTRFDESQNISWEDYDRMVAESAGYAVICQLPYGKTDARLSAWIDRSIKNDQTEDRWITHLVQVLWRRGWIKGGDRARVKEKVPASPWEGGRK
ncbi:hypothetical protein BDW74DRAFT_172891 [Aspergillus multicolor]|uniref:uncharacterized protein n=1 Tax=Aspergillus multicolor TaxID=41759 RepID=UPI003CCDCA09